MKLPKIFGGRHKSTGSAAAPNGSEFPAGFISTEGPVIPSGMQRFGQPVIPAVRNNLKRKPVNLALAAMPTPQAGSARQRLAMHSPYVPQTPGVSAGFVASQPHAVGASSTAMRQAYVPHAATPAAAPFPVIPALSGQQPVNVSQLPSMFVPTAVVDPLTGQYMPAAPNPPPGAVNSLWSAHSPNQPHLSALRSQSGHESDSMETESEDRSENSDGTQPDMSRGYTPPYPWADQRVLQRRSTRRAVTPHPRRGILRAVSSPSTLSEQAPRTPPIRTTPGFFQESSTEQAAQVADIRMPQPVVMPGPPSQAQPTTPMPEGGFPPGFQPTSVTPAPPAATPAASGLPQGFQPLSITDPPADMSGVIPPPPPLMSTAPYDGAAYPPGFQPMSMAQPPPPTIQGVATSTPAPPPPMVQSASQNSGGMQPPPPSVIVQLPSSGPGLMPSTPAPPPPILQSANASSVMMPNPAMHSSAPAMLPSATMQTEIYPPPPVLRSMTPSAAGGVSFAPPAVPTSGPTTMPAMPIPETTPAPTPAMPVPTPVPTQGSTSHTRRASTPYPWNRTPHLPPSPPELSPTQRSNPLDGPFTPPAHPFAYGPPPRKQRRASAPSWTNNPLPPPPRDLFEMSPYKHIVQLPSDPILGWAPGTSHHQQEPPPPPDQRRRRQGNLLQRMFKRGEDGGAGANPLEVDSLLVQYAQMARTARGPGTRAHTIRVNHRPMGVTTHILPRDFAGENGDGSVSDTEDLYDPGERPIVFTQLEPYPGFMNHSPHAIMYGDRSYPTGTHLFEAMKFLPNSPAIAEQIRQCPNVDDVPGISAQFATQQSPDFSQNFMQKYDEVLDLKFNQHPQLRAQLCETARALLLYHDPGDAFWGNGEDGVSGRNECGQALMRARKIFLDRNS